MSLVKGIKGKGNLLVLSDFAVVDNIIDDAVDALSSFKKKGNNIIWLDHHTCSKKAVSRLSKICDVMVVGENVYACGAELVYKFLCDRDEYSDELVRVTHISDFAMDAGSKKEHELIKKISMAIKYMKNEDMRNEKLREFVSCLAKGRMDCAVINEAYGEYMKISRPFLKKMLNTATVYSVNGVKIAIGFGTRISQQEACMELYKRNKTQIAIYVETDSGRGSVRSIRDSKAWGVDSCSISETFLGGGHPLASGFALKNSEYDFSKDKTRERFLNDIKKAADRIYGNKIKYYQQSTGKYYIR